MTQRIVLIVTILLAVVLAPSLHAQEDVEGSGDHPMVPRVAGSYIYLYDYTDFDEVRFPVANLDAEDNAVVREGQHMQLTYRMRDQDTSTLRIMRAYEQALEGAGFETVFSGQSDELGWRQGRGFVQEFALFGREDRHCCRPVTSGESGIRYLAAESADGNVFVSVLTMDTSFNLGPVILVDVVTTAEMDTEMDHVPLSAGEMEQGLVQDGRVAIQNILFGFDSDEILPESADALATIAELMSERSGLKLLVVGHTDNVGDFDYNLRLSMERATAVVNNLRNNHGIAANRLQSAGAGMMAPITTNRTDEGRALNRRVELVELQ